MFRLISVRSSLTVALALSLFESVPISAQTSISSTVRDSGALIKASQNITAYGTDLIGDSVNLYTGALSISNVDITDRAQNDAQVHGRRARADGGGELCGRGERDSRGLSPFSESYLAVVLAQVVA